MEEEGQIKEREKGQSEQRTATRGGLRHGSQGQRKKPEEVGVVYRVTCCRAAETQVSVNCRAGQTGIILSTLSALRRRWEARKRNQGEFTSHSRAILEKDKRETEKLTAEPEKCKRGQERMLFPRWTCSAIFAG